ncbi:metal-dependent hydrolase [Ectothiorhodospiraceae bacterium 2226]|nr:metal-dependent hydrolase [Ectothiorhodospiraceae bacterium 2226]
MDTLTHALSGALLARAATPARPAPGTPGVSGRMAAGFVGGAFPDIDVVTRAVDTLWYLSEVHQRATHSLVLLPLWAVAVAWLFGRASGLRWRGYFVPAALGIGIHIAGDLITAYGTMVLYPLSSWRPALSWTYVVDPYFTVILLAGLLAAWRWPTHAQTAAVAALAALVTYVGMLGLLHQRAVGMAEAYAAAMELPAERGRALPQPFSPAHWMLVVSDGAAHHTAWARLLPGRSLAERLPLPPPFQRMPAHYSHAPEWQRHPRFGRTPDEIEVATEAWRQDEFRYFRRFARLPALHDVDADGDDARQCAWFKDLRFSLPALPPSFVFGMCRDTTDGTWQRKRRRGAMWFD